MSSSESDTTADTDRQPNTQTAEGTPPLRVEGLQKSFEGIRAVDGASFSVEAGTLTGMIGPNGAGKSTTFDCITGFHTPDGGTVELDGRPITGHAPHEIAQAGLVRTFQIARELEEMTVLENLMLAPQHQLGEGMWRAVLPGSRGRRSVAASERELRETVWETLDRFELSHLADEYAGTLSGGQRKLLELARALLADPDVLLLDEPLAGVNPTLEKRLLERIEDLRADGHTFLLVEHDMDVIMTHCDRVIVMNQGDVLVEGPPETVRTNEQVIEAYLGGDV
ncbi:ABC transporter ATP-binding protein [Halovivax cerinus]|uniref:Probable branched-chain amino acid transport ATP-binding protein LivG n=1 Tax=Halovivax cerinus TaxID=1487865 RepID=A0ABD5NSV0_9EURY|nr:ABC transporter ATP-binding protein [Halovivax cerinus]